jgi:hypothetical protein
LQASGAVERGEMTADEFTELAEDVIATKRAAALASKIKDDALVEKAFDQMVELLPAIAGLAKIK